jgi:hypothetical protein
MEIQDLRNYQTNNILKEIENTEKNMLDNKNKIDSFKLEKADLEKENHFNKINLRNLEKEKNNLITYKDEVYLQRKKLEKEIQILKEDYNKTEKIKLENEVSNNRTLKDYENVNKDLKDNNRKNNSLMVYLFFKIFCKILYIFIG